MSYSAAISKPMSIAIPSSGASTTSDSDATLYSSSYASTSSTSESVGSRLYVPRNKRTSSRSDRSESTPSLSPRFDDFGLEDDSTHDATADATEQTDEHTMLIYTPAALLGFANSHMSSIMAPAIRATLEETAPEILTSRSQRRALAFKSGGGRKDCSEPACGGKGQTYTRRVLPGQDRRMVGSRRNYRLGRALPTLDVNWRGRRMGGEAAVPLPAI